MKKLIRVFAGITLLLNIPLTAQLRIGEGSLVKPRTPKIDHLPGTIGVDGLLRTQIVHPRGTIGVDGLLRTQIVHPPGTIGVDGLLRTQTVHLPGTIHHPDSVDRLLRPLNLPPEQARMPQVTLLPLKPSPAGRQEWWLMPGSLKPLEFDVPATAAESQRRSRTALGIAAPLTIK